MYQISFDINTMTWEAKPLGLNEDIKKMTDKEVKRKIAKLEKKLKKMGANFKKSVTTDKRIHLEYLQNILDYELSHR